MNTEMILNKQQSRVYMALLNKPGGVTAGELKEELGIMDGRKRISELRAKGLNIVSAYEHGENRFGETVRFKRYKLKEC